MLISTESLAAIAAVKPSSVATVPASMAALARLSSRSAFKPMRTAASPTRLWKPAMSSGI